MYEAPVKDLNFVIKNLINLEELNKISDYQHFSDDLVDAILERSWKNRIRGIRSLQLIR